MGGFATRAEAQRALKRTLAHLRPGATITLAELVDEYLEVHQALWRTLGPPQPTELGLTRFG